MGRHDGTLVLGADAMSRLVRRVGVDRLMDELIEETASALATLDESGLEIVPRVGFAYDTPHLGALEWMPVMERGKDIVIKVVAENPGSPGRFALPTIVATISRYEVATGRLLSIVDGVFPTALRTGAASAVASRALARPDSAVLGIVGCGAQAVTQVHALSRAFPLREVLASDPDPIALRSFGERIAFTGLRARAVPIDVLECRSDILCTATTVDPGKGPVVGGAGTQPHLHVNAVGSDMPGKFELPVALLRSSLVCPDFLEQAVVEGECQQLAHHEIGPSLPEVVRDAGRFAEHRESRTVFDSTGFSLEDKVVLELLERHARELGLGQQIAIESIPEDAHNPYSLAKPPSEAV